MARKIELKTTKAAVKHVAGKANTFKVSAPQKASKAAPKVTKAAAKKRGRIEYSFNGSGVYAALKFLAENDMVNERDADFASGLAGSITQGQTSQRRFFFAKKLVMKAAHRDDLIEAGFDLGALLQEQFQAPKLTANDFVNVSATFHQMSDSGLAMKVKCAGRNMWVPISQCQFSKTGIPNEPGERVNFKVAKWFAAKNSIVVGE